jgi:multidrug efflux pump subunit AcrB
MAKYILAEDHAPQAHEHGGGGEPEKPLGFFVRFQQGFQRGFDRFHEGYNVRLEQAIVHRSTFVAISLAIALASFALFYFNGRDFFPEVK